MTTLRWRFAWCAAWAIASHAAAALDLPRLLDGFEQAAPWQAQASDAVVASARPVPGSEGRALCLDYDFGKVSGYAQLRRTLAFELPEHYEFHLRVRGSGPANALQFKLVDASGDNVWWRQWARFVPGDDWQWLRIPDRHVSFAWGPAKDRRLRRVAAVELAVAADAGGRGTVCFDQLVLRAVPPPPAAWPVPRIVDASGDATTAPDGVPDNVWRSDGGGVQDVRLDLGVERVFSGLTLDWLPGQHASAYEVAVADDDGRWHTLRRVRSGNGGRDALPLGDTQARWLRLRLRDGRGRRYGLARLRIEDLEWAADDNAFFRSIAAAAPRGHYPRGFVGEQSYWTVVGVDGGPEPALLSEDGAVEPARGGFSLEPFVLDDGALVSWADVEPAHELLDGYLPIPSVSWRHGEVGLRITAVAIGERGHAHLLLRYRLDNHGDASRALSLLLAARPFQVNPPVQFLNTPGGVAPIHALAWDGDALRVNGRRAVFPLQRPDGVRLVSLDADSVPEVLPVPGQRAPVAVRDEAGFASAALRYDLQLAAHVGAEFVVALPLSGMDAPLRLDGLAPSAFAEREQARVAQAWREKLDRVRLSVPAEAQPLADSVRTALAHILINRDGAAIRPGTRAYARSWIRDGAMTSGALLRLGHYEAARDYVRWYAPFQFADGKVPCCVDRRGADPVPENDSHGELIHAIAELYRYGGDRELLATLWPHVRAAAAYMERLRASERTLRNRSAERAAFFGLMPPSISHEGYSDKPAYSYWDDFWALAGYRGAVEIAAALGHDEEAAALSAALAQFRDDLHASIRASVAMHAIDYLPGAADRGDFDATSTTVALAPAGEQAALPQDLLRQTFERYWQRFVERRDGAHGWDVYTPYEWRVVGAFVRLGWRERAQVLWAWFLADRRPAGWNQWAEVVGREPRQPHFIGDMPHGWVASDFIRAALDLFAYERPQDQSLVLAAGVPTQWLVGNGIAVQDLATPYGKLSFSVRQEDDALHLTIHAGLRVPPGGLVFPWPYAGVPGKARSGNRALEWRDGELRIRQLPADIVIAVRGT
ncbi:MAG: discoidin domain-containing protein [Xanthomonadaceae bacterium]|nr:discoidin domain-containing protein [Xanthomonadaceae bacterium]